MSSQYSTEAIVKQISSGVLSGGVMGILVGKGQPILACLTFISIGFIDLAYHFNYLQAHITHLVYDRSTTQRNIRSRMKNIRRDVQRELRDSSDDIQQELQWSWSDVKRYIDRHIYYGMGFTMALVLSIALIPKRRR